MPVLSLVPVQYRDFNRTYLLKQKNQNTLTLRVYDLSHRLLCKAHIRLGDYFEANRTHKFKSLDNVVAWAVEQGKLDQQWQCSATSLPNLDECRNLIHHIKNRLKLKLNQDGEDLERFTCPITLEPLVDPVVDEHGHTYERDAILRHLEDPDAVSPINRLPINTLTPNLALRDEIERLHEKEPISALIAFERNDPSLFALSVSQAKELAAHGEFEGALVSLATGYRFTNRAEDYGHIITFLHQAGKVDASTYATLHQAQTYLSEDKLEEALKALENALNRTPSSADLREIIAFLRLSRGQVEDVICLLEDPESQRAGHSGWLSDICMRILKHDPTQLDLYANAAREIDDPTQRRQILLKGVLEAISLGREDTAHELMEQFWDNPGSDLECSSGLEDGVPILHYNLDVLDRMVELALTSQTSGDEQRSALIRTLTKIVNCCNFFEDNATTLKANKMLACVTQSPLHFEHVMEGYRQLGKSDMLQKWHLALIDLHIAASRWEDAYRVARSPPRIRVNAFRLDWGESSRPILEKLEVILPHTQPDHLKEIWDRLGRSYSFINNLDQQERVYRLGYEKFETFRFAWNLAETLKAAHKNEEAVRYYFAAAEIALLTNESERLSECVDKIREIDPELNNLDRSEKVRLVSHQRIVELQRKDAEREQKFQEALEEKERLELIATWKKQGTIRKKFGSTVFNQHEWVQKIATVDLALLPDNIEQILISPCPFNPTKKVKDTHLLVLIPSRVDNQPITLDKICHLAQNPRNGHKLNIKYEPSIKDKFGAETNKKPYWVLMTKEEIPNSRMKRIDSITSELATKQLWGHRYSFPSLLEATVVISTQYVARKTRLFYKEFYDSRKKIMRFMYPTYIHCREHEEKGFGGCAVGGFVPEASPQSRDGLILTNSQYGIRNTVAASAIVRL